MPLLRLTATAVALLFLVGCQHAAQQSSARTLDAARTRLGVGVGVATLADGDMILPAAAVQARMGYGLTDHVELGISGGTDGLGVQTKLGLIRSETPHAGFNLALEPRVSVGPLAGRIVGTVQLPLLLGQRFGGHELTLGPRVQYSGAFTGSGGPSTGLYAGATLGARIQATSQFIVSPEIGWLHPIADGGQMPLPIVNVGFAWE